MKIIHFKQNFLQKKHEIKNYKSVRNYLLNSLIPNAVLFMVSFMVFLFIAFFFFLQLFLIFLRKYKKTYRGHNLNNDIKAAQ